MRRLLLWLFPGKAAAFEAESRQWMVQCPKCSHEISVWEAGGVRYKAKGTVRRWGRCSQCDQRSMLRIYRPAGPGDGEELGR